MAKEIFPEQESTNTDRDSVKSIGTVGLLDSVDTPDIWTGDGDYFFEECGNVAFGD